MVWRLLGAVGLAGTSLVLIAVLWVVTHLRDLPEVDDEDLRAVPVIAPEDDAWLPLLDAEKALHVDENEAKQLFDWTRGTSCDERGAAALLAHNTGALAALAKADEKPGLALPPERAGWPDPFDKSAAADPILEDTWNLGRLRVLRALWLEGHGDATNAVSELLAAARFGYLVQGAAGAGLAHYMLGAGIKSVALGRLIDLASRSHLTPRALRALAVQTATLGANDRGFAAMWATKYRQQLKARELIEAHFAGRLPADPRANREMDAELLGGHVSPRLLALLPDAYLWQPKRSQALQAEVYRSWQSDASRTWLEHLRAQAAFDAPRLPLLLLLRPNAAGVALYRRTPIYDRFFARTCGENVRAAATTAILALLAYENEHGALPERLDELVPEQRERIPIDDFGRCAASLLARTPVGVVRRDRPT